MTAKLETRAPGKRRGDVLSQLSSGFGRYAHGSVLGMRDDSPIGETEHRITEKAGQRLPVDLPAIIALHHVGHAAGNLHIVVHTSLPDGRIDARSKVLKRPFIEGRVHLDAFAEQTRAHAREHAAVGAPHGKRLLGKLAGIQRRPQLRAGGLPRLLRSHGLVHRHLLGKRRILLVLSRSGLVGLLSRLVGSEHRGASLLKRLRVGLVERLLDLLGAQPGHIDIADLDAGVRATSMGNPIDGANDDERDSAHRHDKRGPALPHKLEPSAKQGAYHAPNGTYKGGKNAEQQGKHASGS